MAKKKTPPAGIAKEAIKEQPKAKELTIHGMFGYKIIISKNGYEVHYDQSNENNLTAMAICDQIFGDLINGVEILNVYSEKDRKAKRDRLERLRKLKLEVVNSMAEVAEYLLQNKDQEHYDLVRDKIMGKKSKIIQATEGDVKKIIMPGK